MRGSMNGGGIPAEARHRVAGNRSGAGEKSLDCGSFKEAKIHFKHLLPERTKACKLHSLKLVLVVIISGTFFTILHSPLSRHANLLNHSSRSSFGWIGEKRKTDNRYVSDLDVDWSRIITTLVKIDYLKGNHKIGLLNFDDVEINHWKKILPDGRFSVIHLDHAQNNITWDVMYPEWIDEEEESEVPTCPHLPRPKASKGINADLIAVKLPCNSSSYWSRDVARLHLQIAAAKVAVNSSGAQHPVNVLFVTNCFPIPNLFTCKDLVTREGSIWLYKPDIRVLSQKLELPVGSCQLSLPLKAKERPRSEAMHREAYATVLHSADVYVCGAIAAAQSIRFTGSKRDLVILVDETVSVYHRNGLEAAGWKIKTIQRIRNPKAERDAYNEWNYSKFRLWQLTEYDKIIFIDADLLVLRNIDFLFTLPEITATGNNGTLFNSGVMVIEPSNCTFQLLMDHINEIESYNGGDQGYLNEIFTRWHRIPRRMNFLKHFWEGDEPEIKEMKTQLFGADPPIIYVLHYLGQKPWLCFRDYDCNWNVDILQEFASDIAHQTWWKVHDKMPKRLQRFCLLSTKQKAGLEWDRMQAEKANFTDGHWRRNISDPRRKICDEEFCRWKNMLRHWGDPNWETGCSNLTFNPASKLHSL